MNDKNKHERTKRIFKITGICLIVAGAAFAITGFIDFFTSFGTGDMPSLFWCLFIGLPMLAAGASPTALGFRREITGYVKNETIPVINEAGQEITPAVSAIAKAVKGEESNLCPICSKPNDEEAKFCRHCGADLLVTCKNCGKKVKSGAFCSECGAKLE